MSTGDGAKLGVKTTRDGKISTCFVGQIGISVFGNAAFDDITWREYLDHSVALVEANGGMTPLAVMYTPLPARASVNATS